MKNFINNEINNYKAEIKSVNKNDVTIMEKYKDKNKTNIENEIKQKLDEEFKKLKEKINKAHKILHDKYQASNWFEDKATKNEKSIITSLKSANTRSDIDITEEKYNERKNLFNNLSGEKINTGEIDGLGFKKIKQNKGKGYKKKLIFGRGYEKVKKNLAQINKYYIDLDALNKNVLKLKYVKNRNIVPNCPIQRGISDDVKNMIIDITENNFYKEKYNKLSERDKQIFIDFCNSAHLDVGISLDKTNEDEKQLNILYGAYMAGNKDEKIITQIKKLLSKAMKLNKISSKQAISILEDLE